MPLNLLAKTVWNRMRREVPDMPVPAGMNHTTWPCGCRTFPGHVRLCIAHRIRLGIVPIQRRPIGL